MGVAEAAIYRYVPTLSALVFGLMERLERLSPLAVVAIGGLMVSTFLTMVYVPVFYSLFDEAEAVARRLAGRVTARPAEA